MKNILFITSILIFLTACSSTETSEGDPAITALEATVQAQPTAENSKKLVEQYQEYVKNHPTDDEMNSRYLYRAAELQYRMNRFSAATKLLEQALKEHYKSSNTANNALLLASIYKDKLRNEVAASTIYQCFLEVFPNHEKVPSIKEDYGNESPIADKIVDLGNRLMNDSTNRIDYRVANQFIKVCEINALLKPTSAKSAQYLHKAGETARSLRSFPKALEIYDWIYEKYPNSEKAPQALFLKAFTYDNDLKNYDEAKKYYEEFIKKYPDNDFADDTQFLLENLGKNDEEIIQSFGK